MIFVRFFWSIFLICLIILCTPIPIVFFLGFSIWGSHSHFVGARYIIGGPIGRNVVCFCSPSRSLPYNSSTPYLCSPILGRWYTYSRSHIKYGFYIFTIIEGVISIRFFNATNEMCSLVSLRVRPLYITSSSLYYSRFEFSYFGCTGGIHIICWLFVARVSPWGS
jgi:hypothetical protein